MFNTQTYIKTVVSVWAPPETVCLSLWRVCWSIINEHESNIGVEGFLLTLHNMLYHEIKLQTILRILLVFCWEFYPAATHSCKQSNCTSNNWRILSLLIVEHNFFCAFVTGHKRLFTQYGCKREIGNKAIRKTREWIIIPFIDH